MSKDKRFLLGWLFPIAAAVAVAGFFIYGYGLWPDDPAGTQADAIQPQTNADRANDDIAALYSRAESLAGHGVAGRQASAKLPSSADHVRLSAQRDGRNVQTQLAIEEQWHINANPASFDFLIPTTVDVLANDEPLPSNFAYPAGHAIEVGLDQPIQVYTHRLELTTRLARAARDAKLTAKARVQACNDAGLCLPPAILTTPITDGADRGPEAQYK
ncbi:protein-disulfide reductase DsbD domain-containing protein [Salinisphaera hydrothermalis]|uniref:protein-disulfide reductase DsbD domain-containing protein n=1 Tax=Salinisphaera hydrothermalis TaxID=563188 RepID=UPI00333F37BF